jgi:hypothetical protein
MFFFFLRYFFSSIISDFINKISIKTIPSTDIILKNNNNYYFVTLSNSFINIIYLIFFFFLKIYFYFLHLPIICTHVFFCFSRYNFNIIYLIYHIIIDARPNKARFN